jgi:glycosyltransferase involved in cell wall biosynthesis
MSRPVFVIPHYSVTDQSWAFLMRTLASLVAQTDPDWDAIVVDDGSPAPDRTARLARARALDRARIHVLEKRTNEGPGSARNVGIAWAAERHAPFILYIDADDLAHPDRLRLSRGRLDDPEVGFVYSTYDVVNEDEEPVPLEELTPSVREILDGHACNPINGPDQWRRVAVEKGYTTSTSTVAVRTHLAMAHPYPGTYVSEDSHTWLRILATGTTVAFVDVPLLRRRICSSVKGSTTRQRYGQDFYWIKLHVDLDGFTRALAIARADGRLDDDEEPALRRAFHLRQARTMAREGQEIAATLCHGLAALHAAEPAFDRSDASPELAGAIS